MARKRSYITGLSNLLATCPQPVYVLNAESTIIYCNPACTAWLGTDARELVGTVCRYHSGAGDAAFRDPAQLLCPPPEALQGQEVSARLAFRSASGHVQWREIQCLPLGEGPSDCVGTLVRVSAPCQEPPAISAIPSAAELHQLLRRMLADLNERYPLNQILGVSDAIARVRRRVQLATGCDAPVLVFGAPGSGREYVARSIHYGNPSPAGPLAPLACALLDAELLETTFNSLRAGSGTWEAEQTTTLLLLEVDQLPADGQLILAAALQSNEVAVRTIATARHELTELARQGRFRQDLAFALSTLSIEIPPLNSRPQDIPLLAQWFLERANTAGGRQLSGFTAEVQEQLMAYPWTGNGDELADVVRQACAEAQGPLVRSDDLPEVVRFSEAAERHATRRDYGIQLDEFLASIEKEVLQRTLQRTRGNRAKAARLLGVSRARLLRKLEQHDLG